MPWRSAALLVWWLAACAVAVAPIVIDEPVRERLAAGRRTVVLVPGVTGSQLRTEAGRPVFGGSGQFFAPRDGGYRLARSLLGRRRPLEAFDVIRELRIPLLFRKPIYQPVVDLLVEAGFVVGDPAAPAPDASLYLFAYDWRQDNIDSAAGLTELLRGIRRVNGDRPVDLICQSNGAHVCRWAARFGSATLEEAERGASSAAGIGRLILVGASNGGSLRILREMNRGRRYVPWVGRRFRPEVFFTFPSLFVDLPAEADGLFVDATGVPLSVDLYDAASWERYGWSIFAPDAARRAGSVPELYGDRDRRLEFLRRQLARARRFQRLLAGDAGEPEAAAYHLIENAGEATPHRAVLARDSGGWRTSFTGDRRLRAHPDLAGRISAPGDGHSTVESQRSLSSIERVLLEPPLRVTGGHFEMLLEPETRRYLLESLATPLPSHGDRTPSSP